MSNTKDNSITEMGLCIQMLGKKFDKDTAHIPWLAFAKVPEMQRWKVFTMKQNTYLLLTSFYI